MCRPDLFDFSMIQSCQTHGQVSFCHAQKALHNKVGAIAEPFLTHPLFFSSFQPPPLHLHTPAHLPKADVVSLAGVAAQQDSPLGGGEADRLRPWGRAQLAQPASDGPWTGGGLTDKVWTRCALRRREILYTFVSPRVCILRHGVMTEVLYHQIGLVLDKVW